MRHGAAGSVTGPTHVRCDWTRRARDASWMCGLNDLPRRPDQKTRSRQFSLADTADAGLRGWPGEDSGKIAKSDMLAGV